jgi:hypothetical protein
MAPIATDPVGTLQRKGNEREIEAIYHMRSVFEELGTRAAFLPSLRGHGAQRSRAP